MQICGNINLLYFLPERLFAFFTMWYMLVESLLPGINCVNLEKLIGMYIKYWNGLFFQKLFLLMFQNKMVCSFQYAIMDIFTFNVAKKLIPHISNLFICLIIRKNIYMNKKYIIILCLYICILFWSKHFFYFIVQ